MTPPRLELFENLPKLPEEKKEKDVWEPPSEIKLTEQQARTVRVITSSYNTMQPVSYYTHHWDPQNLICTTCGLNRLTFDKESGAIVCLKR